MKLMLKIAGAGALMLGVAVSAVATVVDVVGVGAEKLTVQIAVDNPVFAKSLKRNLELSGRFVVGAKGSIAVSGKVGSQVVVEGPGQSLTSSAAVTDDRSARMAARQLANSICETFGHQKGFATDRVTFVRKSPGANEICAAYPDGYDIVQLTHDGKIAIGPRWKNASSIYYVGYLNGVQQVYELDVATGRKSRAWNIKGVSSPAVVSPDGTKVALVASFQGNPELYVLSGGSYTRLTNTPNATEGQPCWSPDGREIAYVSDESRHPQIYVINVAAKARRRLTTKGSQNVDPDWGADGRLAYITKRGGGAQVAVMEPAEGERSVRLVTGAGNWEHPSWARDGRNLVASRDQALFVVDTLTTGEQVNPPQRLFSADGKWVTPCWSR